MTMIFNKERIKLSLRWHYEYWFRFPLYKLMLPHKVRKLRSKNTIKVLFVLTEIGPWKTKELYKAMLVHPRFQPILGISESAELSTAKAELINYLDELEYDYVDLDITPKLTFKKLSPDIIFYQKPYDWCYQPHLLFKKHLSALFCYVAYCFHTTNLKFGLSQPLFYCVWQQYYENDLLVTPERLSMMPDKGKQIIVTGLPIQDQLMKPKEQYQDPWKKQARSKKRIIYAPHHTISSKYKDGLALSTFLENADVMLEMMHKYSDRVQWAFKPHPLLYRNLLSVWGQEKTDKYYNEWKNADNSQFEDGEYDALFKYSDAMIHDCSSFTIEYLYTKNPVMFLVRQNGGSNPHNAFSQKADELHQKGLTKADIDSFILDVINGIDPLKEEKEKFYNDSLTPPNGKTACENIINSILGE